MELVNKIVEFDKYCDTCEFRDLKHFEDPCDRCLAEPVNTYSRKPVYYKKCKKYIEEKEKKEKQKEDIKEE